MIRLKLNRAAKAANCNVPLFVSRYTGEQGTGYLRGRIHVRAKTRRKGKHVRGEDTHA